MLEVYFKLGFYHILNWSAIDHIAFIFVICAMYSIKDWKKVLYLATAFTIGHSLTLALSALNIIHINSDLIETLIPITIIVAAMHNLCRNLEEKNKFSYLMVGFFGLIHGLGFSNYFSASLVGEERLILPLLYFNIGVELGQFIAILALLLLTYFITEFTKIKNYSWTHFLSGIGFGIAITLLF